MPGLYTITTRSTGTILTAAIYNADHQNHVDNETPQMMDDYSTNATQMQATADPGEVSTESLPTSLAGELERLRFAIQDIKAWFGLTSAQWYSTPVDGVKNVENKAQTLTDAATIAWDASLGSIATVTLGANRILGAPTNLKKGYYTLKVIQDGTGSRTLDTSNAIFKWPLGSDPIMSTAAGAVDILSFFYDGTSLHGSHLKGMA